MMSTRAAAVGLLLAAAGAFVGPAAAQADPWFPPGVPRDGYLYLSSNPQDTDIPPRQPELCSDYLTDVADLGACKNKASYAFNNGFTGSYAHVKLHNYTNFAGAAYCLRNGEMIDNMEGDVFTQGAVSQGRGAPLNNAIESVHWVNAC